MQCRRYRIRKEVDVVLNYTIWEAGEIDNLTILHAMGTLVKEDENTIGDRGIKDTSLSCSEFNVSLTYSRDSWKTVSASNAMVQTDCQSS